MEYVAGTKVRVNLDAFPAPLPDVELPKLSDKLRLHPSVKAFSRKKTLARVRFASGLSPKTEPNTYLKASKKEQPAPKVFGLGGEGGGDAEVESHEDMHDKTYGKRWKIRGPRIVPQPLVVPMSKCVITQTAAHLSWITHQRDRCRELLKTAADHMISSQLLENSAQNNRLRSNSQEKDVQSNQQQSQLSDKSKASLTFETHPMDKSPSRLTYLKQLSTGGQVEEGVQKNEASSSSEVYALKTISPQKTGLLPGLSPPRIAALAASSDHVGGRPTTAPSRRIEDISNVKPSNDQAENFLKTSLFASTALMPQTQKQRPFSATPYLSLNSRQMETSNEQTKSKPNDKISPTHSLRRASVVTIVLDDNENSDKSALDETEKSHMAEVDAYIRASENANRLQDELFRTEISDKKSSTSNDLYQRLYKDEVLKLNTNPNRPQSAVAAAEHAKNSQGWFRSLVPRPHSAAPIRQEEHGEKDSSAILQSNQTNGQFQNERKRQHSPKAVVGSTSEKRTLRPSSVFPSRIVSSEKALNDLPSRPKSSSILTNHQKELQNLQKSALKKDRKRVAWLDHNEASILDESQNGSFDETETKSSHGDSLPANNIGDDNSDSELDEWEAQFDSIAGVAQKPSRRKAYVLNNSRHLNSGTPDKLSVRYSSLQMQNHATRDFPPQTTRFLKSLQNPVDTKPIDIYAQNDSAKKASQLAASLVLNALHSETQVTSNLSKGVSRRGSVWEMIGKDDENEAFKNEEASLHQEGKETPSNKRLPRRASLLASAALNDAALPKDAPADVIASMVAASESATNVRDSHTLIDWALTHDQVVAETVTALDDELSKLFGF